jgi:hypothetical protein
MAKYICYGGRSANDFKHEKRDAVFKEAAEDGPKFWKRQSKSLEWSKRININIDTRD